jgi:hypothetical protein
LNFVAKLDLNKRKYIAVMKLPDFLAHILLPSIVLIPVILWIKETPIAKPFGKGQ